MHKYYARIYKISCNLRYDKVEIIITYTTAKLSANIGGVYKKNPSCNRTGYKSRLPPLTLRTPAMHLIRASLNAGTTANSTWLIFLPFDLQLRSDIHLHLTCICISPSQTLFDFLTQTTVSVTVFMVLFIF